VCRVRGRGVKDWRTFNFKAAEACLNVAPTLRARADEVIE
jgi:hypothetical protein